MPSKAKPKPNPRARAKKKASPKKAAAARENGKMGGRPRRELTGKERAFFDAMCAAGALEKDISEALAIDRDTLAAICKRDYGMGFSAYREQKRGKGRAALASKQLQVAMSGNPTMLIWLGKQWLDQHDRRELTGKGGAPLAGIVVRFSNPPQDDEPTDDGTP